MAHKWRGKVPFDQFGNQQHYPKEQRPINEQGEVDYSKRVSPKWKKWYSFDATLQLDKITSGRSAKYLTVKDIATNKKYTLFIVDFVDAANKSYISHGKITGTWGFCKRGQNYGVYLMESSKKDFIPVNGC